MFSYFLFAHFFIVIFNLLRNIVMEIVCWDARNLTLIVNIFWAILCFFLCCALILRECYIMISGKSCYGKNFTGLMLLHVILHTYNGPWTASHQRASWNYQPSISPSLCLPFIYQGHVDTHEFTFFLRIPSLPDMSNRTSIGLGQRSAFNSIRNRSLCPLNIAELQREDVDFCFL